MIPERVEPGLAPDGVVVVIFDLADAEITRSVVTPDRMVDLDWMAEDSGEEVNRRGGGRLVAYDGDTGERMLVGPQLAIRDGAREPVTHHIRDLFSMGVTVCGGPDEPWPWQLIGVFSTEEQLKGPDDFLGAWWNYFCYTVGYGPVFELWVPCASIEGRLAGPDLIGETLNYIAAGMSLRAIATGDSVIVPFGVPDAPDVDTVWWIGEPVLDFDARYQCNMSDAPGVVPIRWSSGLGWKEDA